MPSITIDGIAVQVAEGSTILDAAQVAGISIPTLCFLKERSAIGSCRVCVVDVEGEDYPVPSCTTVVREGMVISTDSPRITAYRRIALDLIASDVAAGGACETCSSDEWGELGELCRTYGVTEPSYAAPVRTNVSVLDDNPFLSYDPARCIRCQRCVGACNKAAYNHTLHAGKRGLRTTIEAPFGKDWLATDCESCGTCAQACPTGALTIKRRRAYHAQEAQRVRTTCPHCGVGCQLDLVVQDGRIVDAIGAQGPSNKGLLCVKGRSASFDFVDAADRLRTPLVKNPATGEFESATWDEALDLVARRFTELRDEYGGQSLAAFACSRSSNEDIYLFQKMARTALVTNNVDCCARV